MSAEFPSLTEVLDKRIEDVVNAEALIAVDASEWLATAWHEACNITTAEQLDALPDGAVIRWDRGPGIEAQVLQRGGGNWLAPGNDSSEPHGAHLLPARLLDHPDWEARS